LELHGFYRRMQDRENGVNTGVFIRQEEIERRNPSRFTQLLEGIPSMRLIRSGACGTLWRCYAPRGADGCYMSVFLDGHRLNPLHVPPHENPWLRRDFPDELISPGGIAGIEVYARVNQAPPQYQGLAGCGVILVWTK